MAPRTTASRRTKPEIEVKSLKRTPSTTSTVTSKPRAHQPLAPSTSQNSLVKPAAVTKHKPRKASQSKIKVEEIKEEKATSKGSATVELQKPKLNVYVFGSGSMGELGLGPDAKQRNVKRPRLNSNLLPESVGIEDIAAGGMHCAAIDDKGRVWTWGVNDQGVLGRDTTWTPPENEDTAMDSDDEEEEQLNPLESVPGLVEGFPDGTIITKVACGDSITVALTNKGQVYAWGTFRVGSI
jgi:regulator of chromosome condensation